MSNSDLSSVKKFKGKIFGTMTEEKSTLSLAQLCNDIIETKKNYEDYSENIEKCAYNACERGNIDFAVQQLVRISTFFENLDNKNEENSRDLSDVYLLIGQMFQFSGKYEESIVWFSRSVVVDDQYSVPYHNLAISYDKLNNLNSVIRCLEQEIALAPGNYYSYLYLADVYERLKMYSELENCLKRLLERDPDNMQGLHKIIRYYEKKDPDVDISLLFRRLLGINKTFNRTEILIRIYYLCKDFRFTEAIEAANAWQYSNPDTSIICLVKAYIYGIDKKNSLRKKEIALFSEKCSITKDVLKIKLEEFGKVFGRKATYQMSKFIFPATSKI